LPNDKLSHKLISPNLVQSVCCPSPIIYKMENNVRNSDQDMENFETSKNGLDMPKLTMIEFTKCSGKFTSISSFHQNNLSCITSPELADNRNIAENPGIKQNAKTPPPPPPRWAKFGINQNQNQNNLIVTTTMTFNINHGNSSNTSQVKLKKRFFLKFYNYKSHF